VSLLYCLCTCWILKRRLHVVLNRKMLHPSSLFQFGVIPRR
jgi:hypothetical protein